MLRVALIFCTLSLLFGCDSTENQPSKSPEETVKESSELVISNPFPVELTLPEAAELASMPLKCLQKPYPNKLGQVIASEKDLQSPQELHPAFYGCFDWHSSVHGHWSLVKLLKMFPDLPQKDLILKTLQENITEETIAGEVLYFENPTNRLFERTYGWAWLLKLNDELSTWDHPAAKDLHAYLSPLTSIIVERYVDFMPKLLYPIRVGEHKNTAFGMSFAYDHAIVSGNETLKKVLSEQAMKFYFEDADCPLSWEPSGYDFLSPCLEEANLMMRVLPEADFLVWLDNFLPQLSQKDFNLEVGRVESRDDGTLVHLDGLNFSRSWTLMALSQKFPKYAHLEAQAGKHINHSFQLAVANPHYEGEHWVGSFAVYALGVAMQRKIDVAETPTK